MRKRLLTVQGPLQFITGSIAFTWQAASQPTEDTLLLYDFLSAAEDEDPIATAVRSLAATSVWKRVVHIRGHQMDALMRRRYTHSMAGLKQLLGEASFDDIYVARDHIGHGSALLLNTYANANKHSYGDSFGVVGQHEAMKRLETPPSLPARLRTLARRLLLGGPAPVPFDDAVLSLPIDISGTYLRQVPLIVPPRDHVVRALASLYAAVPDLGRYCDDLKTRVRGQHSHLYLLSNLAGSGLSTIENEIELYLEIIRTHSRPGETVLIKPHPRSSFKFLQDIQEALRPDHEVVLIDDPRFARLPIELWVGLLEHCELVAMFSTSSINLKYLYGKDVTLPLDDTRIVRFILPSGIEHVASAYRMMKQALRNLDTWDGRTPLWCPA